ncbi:hypothetical protein [Agrococcus sp. ProA11]|uniref:hypothetical protein n=1 Tax=Agrococcus chionoecetis TaxID=3153752 RepID=UPI0032602498
MNTTRILAGPAIAAAALLALTGCIQLPPVVGGDGTTTEPSTDGGSTDGGTTDGGTTDGDTGSEDLAGTTWTGGELGPDGETFAAMEFTLNADGTVDISDWNNGDGGPFDSPADVWSGDPSNLSITITELADQNTQDEAFDITFTGTATEGVMSLTGDGPDGTWMLTATEG